VIKRIEAYARQPIQRIGLSATVGKAREEVRVSTS
jgi:Lhr-like helicase